MCGPLLIPVMVIGTGVQAYGQYKQGQFQKDMSKYQASLERQRAGYAQKQGEIEAAAAEKRHRQIVGAGLTAFAGNGVLLESREDAAASMWEVDQAKELAYDKELIKTNAELAAWGFKTNAAALKEQGKMDAWAGTMGAVGTIFSGAGSTMASYSASKSSGAKYTSGSNPTGGWASESRSSAIA